MCSENILFLMKNVDMCYASPTQQCYSYAALQTQNLPETSKLMRSTRLDLACIH